MAGLALPLMLSSLASAGLGLFNAVQVAPLGADALAAVGFGAMVVGLVQSIGIGLFGGGRIAIAQALGAGDRAAAARTARLMLACGVAIGLGATLAIPLAPALMAALGVPQRAVPAAADYLVVRLAAAPLMGVFDAAVHAVQGPGDAAGARRTTQAMVVLGAVAIGTAPLFVGVLGLGAAGTAWASDLGFLAGLVVLVPRVRALAKRAAGDARGGGRKLVALGLPLAGLNVADAASHLALQALLAHLGEVDLAAHVLVLRLTGLALLPAYAIGDALSVLVGRAAGARRHELVRPAATKALRLAIAFVAVTTTVFVAAPEALASVSGATPDVAAVAARLLVVGALFQLVEGAVAIGLGALAGLGHTRFLLVATVATAWLVKLPLTAALTRLGMGIDAAWWAWGAEIVVLGALVGRRLRARLAAARTIENEAGGHAKVGGPTPSGRSSPRERPA